MAGNVIEPVIDEHPPAGYVAGRSETQDFVDPYSRNLYPSADSALLGAGDPAHASIYDFNGIPRRGNADAGAYHWTGEKNPGWMVAPGFKKTKPSPTSVIAD